LILSGEGVYLLQNLKLYLAFFSVDNGGSFPRVKEFMCSAPGVVELPVPPIVVPG